MSMWSVKDLGSEITITTVYPPLSVRRADQRDSIVLIFASSLTAQPCSRTSNATVIIAAKRLSPLIAPRDDVIEQSGREDSGTAGHEKGLTETGDQYQDWSDCYV